LPSDAFRACQVEPTSYKHTVSGSIPDRSNRKTAPCGHGHSLRLVYHDHQMFLYPLGTRSTFSTDFLADFFLGGFQEYLPTPGGHAEPSRIGCFLRICLTT
jgi:hypothetical protein